MSKDVSNVDLTKELIEIIRNSKEKVFQKINEVLLSMYWKVGEKLYNVSKDADFGDNYIDKIASNISAEFPVIKGFDRRGLYRMKQFYETYKDDQFVTTLLTQISWTNHLIILSKAKTILVFIMVILLFSCNKTNDVESENVKCFKKTYEYSHIYKFTKDESRDKWVSQNIKTYDDVLKLYDDEYKKHISGEFDFGWANELNSFGEKCNYCIYDFDNNGIDEIAVYNEENKYIYMFEGDKVKKKKVDNDNEGNRCIYMFTKNDGGTIKCLINNVGYHEIQFSTSYYIFGDDIIGIYDSCSTDYTMYSFNKIVDNQLVEIERFYAGFITLSDGKFEYVVMHIKGGVVNEISNEELDVALKNYRSLKPVKRVTKTHIVE